MDNSYKYKYKPCTIVIYEGKKDTYLKEISLIAYEKDSKKIVAVGNDAENLLNSDDNIVIMSPLKNGFIANFEEAHIMFKYFIKKVHKSNVFSKPKVIICVPPEPTDVEEKAYNDTLLFSGAKQVSITQESIDNIMSDEKENYDIIISILI